MFFCVIGLYFTVLLLAGFITLLLLVLCCVLCVLCVVQVTGLVALVPKSHPAPTVFQQSVRIELEAVMGLDAAAASLGVCPRPLLLVSGHWCPYLSCTASLFPTPSGKDAMPDMAAVLACAAEERQKREAVLVQSSTRLSSAYRGYRGRLRLRGTALARLSCIVCAGHGTPE